MKFEVLDTVSGAWSSLQPIPSQHCAAAGLALLVVSETQLVAVWCHTHTAQTYNVSTDTWCRVQLCPDVPLPRRPLLVGYGGKDLYVYDPDNFILMGYSADAPEDASVPMMLTTHIAKYSGHSTKTATTHLLAICTEGPDSLVLHDFIQSSVGMAHCATRV